MELAPDIAAFIRRSDEVFPPGYLEQPLARQREMYAELCRVFATSRPTGVSATDESVPAQGRQIPIRVYRPPGELGGQVAQGCLLYMHGGGFVLGDLDSHDGITADIAAGAGVTVIAIDYRLAPEHPFPAAFEDCTAVLNHVVAQAARLRIDPARLAVGGDSAGGNLAAALCLWARAHDGPPLAAQVLIYPGGLSWRHDPMGEQPADDAPLLSHKEIRYFAEAYLGPGGTTEDPHAAPLLARDYRGLPPAFISAAMQDPLCADSQAYAERLNAAGVSVALQVAPGLIHGWLRARRLSREAAEAFAAVCDATARYLKTIPAPTFEADAPRI